MSRVHHDRVRNSRVPGRTRKLFAGFAAIALLTGLGAAGTSPALAQDSAGTDPVSFPDKQLVACINEKLGGGRAADQPITHDELNTIFGLSCGDSFAVASLDGIEHAQKITNLFFAGGKHDFSGPGSLEAAAKMPKLNSLTLTDAKVTNAALAGLTDAATLSTLSLTGSPELSDISPLGKLPKLSKLDLSRNVKLTDLSPLSDAGKLKDFTASQIPDLVDLEPLRNLNTLTSVSVYKTAVATLEPLSGLTGLTSISAQFTQVSTLLPISKLTKMRFLTVDHAQLQSLAGIEDMSELQTLDINNNPDIGDDIGAIRNKPELYRVHMNAIGATSVEPLSGLTGLKSLQALGNHFGSLVGLPEAPEQNSVGTFAVTAQQISGSEVFVPKGAKQFRYDAAGQLELRDGSFPDLGGNLKPKPDPELPIMLIDVRAAWPELEYTFAHEAKSNDRFTGTVAMPIVWSMITSPDSATLPLGEAWRQEISYTAGFPAASFELSSDAPAWLKVVDGAFVGTPDGAGDWTFELRVADELGNTMQQRVDLTVPQPDATVFEIGEDQQALAGTDLTFTVSRTDAAENAFSGEASVRVKTHDGTAVDGSHYVGVDQVLSWPAGNQDDKQVVVQTLAGAAGDEDRALTLELSDPTPEGLTELGGGFMSDGTITYPTPEATQFSVSAPQVVEAGTADVEFTVTRKDAAENPWTGEASIRVVSHDGTAKAGTHFTEVDETLTWKANESGGKTFRVQTHEGKAGDPNRVFALRLTDAQPRPYAKPSKLAFSGVELTYPTPEPTSFGMSGDAAGAAGDSFTFEIRREDAQVNPWTGVASVRVSTQDGTAQANAHYAPLDETVTWADADSEPKHVVIETTKMPAGDPERDLTVVLSQPEPAAHTQLIEPAASTLTLRSPEPGTTVFAMGDDQSTKAGGTLTFTVSRADAEVDPWTGEASVRVSTQDGSAVAGTHYEPIAETLVWGAGDSATQSVTVQTAKVTSKDPERSFTVTLSEPSSSTAVGDPAAAAGTIAYASEEGPIVPGEEGEGDGGITPKPTPDGGDKGAPNAEGGLAHSGLSVTVWALSLGAAVLALLIGLGLFAARGRRTL
ncbi:Calx-beta domain-containing protein [Leucobacter sp. BZR 635]